MNTRQEKATMRLYKAVQHYLEVHGGSAVVAAGVEVQQYPDETFNFRLAVKVTGKLPEGFNDGGG